MEHNGNDLTQWKRIEIKDLTNAQFLELWNKYPAHKWNILADLVDLTPAQTDVYKQWYDNKKKIQEKIDNAIKQGDATNKKTAAEFFTSIDDYIADLIATDDY